MAITNFQPEIWAAQLLVSLKKTLIAAGPGVVNRNYEGQIANSGDTVRITSISRPTAWADGRASREALASAAAAASWASFMRGSIQKRQRGSG